MPETRVLQPQQPGTGLRGLLGSWRRAAAPPPPELPIELRALHAVPPCWEGWDPLVALSGGAAHEFGTRWGASCRVFAAAAPDGTRVVVKAFAARALAAPASKLARDALNEVTMGGLLGHANVAPILAVHAGATHLSVVFADRGTSWLACWRPEGRAGSEDLEVLQMIARDVGPALAHMHALGHHHGDVKLENLTFVNRPGHRTTTHLVDLATAGPDRPAALADFTYSYLPPECAFGLLLDEIEGVPRDEARAAAASEFCGAYDVRCLAQVLASLALGTRFYEWPGDREANGGRGPTAREVARRILDDPEPWATHERWGRLHPALRGAISAMGCADATTRPTMEEAMGLPLFTADLGAGEWRYAGAMDAAAADGGAGTPAGAPAPQAPAGPVEEAPPATALAQAPSSGGAGLPFMGGRACVGCCGRGLESVERWGSGDLAMFVGSMLSSGEEGAAATGVVSIRAGGTAGAKNRSGVVAAQRAALGTVAVRFRAWWRRLSRRDEAHGTEETKQQEQEQEQAQQEEQQDEEQQQSQPQLEQLQQEEQQQQDQGDQEQQGALAQQDAPAAGARGAEVSVVPKRSLLQRAVHRVHKRCMQLGRRVPAQVARAAAPFLACSGGL